MSYAQFELAASEEGSIALARRVYERANQSLRGANEKEERVLLLEAWRDFESQQGDEESLRSVIQKMPRRVKKRQRVQADDGVSLHYEIISCSNMIRPSISYSEFKFLVLPPPILLLLLRY
jgi:hypothetical protein